MPGLLTNDMPGTPGAISQMLGLLMQQPAAGQPGQPAPAPVAPMPMQAPHPMEHVEPAQSLLGKIHDYISDRVGIKEPGGYRGLLSDEEIQQAKPGILASGAGDSWREKLDSIVKMKQFAAGLAEQNRIQKVRSEMPQNLDLPGMLKYAAQHGDVEMIKSLGGPLEGMLSTKPNAASANIKEVPGVGAVDFTDPAHPVVVMKAGATPRNIDPLSPEGIAAGLKLAAGKAAQKGGLGNLPAPMASKVGQAGEMIKKLSDILPQMDALDVNLGNSAGEDIAEHGVGAFGVHIPGTKGIGSLMVNRSPQYSRYEASLSPFVLAAAHALSGARINMDQVEQIRRSIKYEPGDTAPVKAQKRKNLIDLVNSISGSLPADAIASQEDQMDPGAMAVLKGYGYKGAARADATPAPKTPGRKKTAAEILAAHGIK